MSYYYSFNQYLKETFGERVHRLSLDAGFSCPNIDGTLSGEGCVFCNNAAFSRFAGRKPVPLAEQIVRSMEFARARYGAKKFIAYFQSFSNTYSETAFLKNQYDIIRRFDNIVGLSISTRPDCIDEEKLDLIESFSEDYKVYIEYGLQSAHDESLARINRNHSFEDFQKAVAHTAKRKDIKIGVHLILGLLNESKRDMLVTARILRTMPLWGIKFHCLHVVKGTGLEELYNRGEAVLLSEDAYIDALVSFLELIPEEFVILRLVSDADKDLLIAPRWLNEKQRILRKIEDEFKKRGTRQGFRYKEKVESKQ